MTFRDRKLVYRPSLVTLAAIMAPWVAIAIVWLILR